jgi:Transposase IS66 family
MGNGLPEIAPEERTPLVLALLDIIQQQREAIQQLRDEIARLKGQKPKPQIQPSRLEQAPRQPPAAEGEQRPGSQKRAKNAELTIHREVPVAVPNPPVGSVSLGSEPYVVQELVIKPENTRYWRERIRTPQGETLLAPLPAGVLPGLHFGATLICYVRHQYHHNHVTQPLLLEQLREFGIDISAGQLSRLLTENLEVFHDEKEALLAAGLKVSSYVGVDDTGARHQGKTGFCTHIGNELFAYFESTDSKSRLNFLEILRRPHTDYVINDAALAYWRRQKMPAEVFAKLRQPPGNFADASAWRRWLRELAITAKWHVRMATEGALLGSLIAHGVSPHLVVLSDGASQFDVLVHASCWIHAERPLARLVPASEEQRGAVEAVRQQIWELYQDLKAYRQQPEPARQPGLIARFEALVGQRTEFPSIHSALKEMRSHQADLLRVLQRPEVPLHNNTSEAHIRDYVKKRKISGSTRSDAGRRCRDTFASLKKTCRSLGVNFWVYLQDRVRGLGQLTHLADLLRQRAAEARMHVVPC